MSNEAQVIDAAYQSVVAEWMDKGIADRDQLAAALTDYRVRFAYHSGTIENPAITYHDTRDVFEDGRVVGFTGDPRTLFEIQNLKECHEVILDAFASNRKLDEQLVLEVHRTLTQGTYDERRWAAGERPGAYKVGDYMVGAGDVGATPAEVRAEIAALLAEVSQAPLDKALTVAAYFHAVFENIHPFSDGNGRCGRELMNYLLISRRHPPIVVFEDDRMAYFGSLEAWDAERDLEPLMVFLKAEAVRTWRLG
ncbi:MAG: Fic family protein [Coriobacteriales bacterium]|nr:Fic family protein [Coriobacteriales bacterium]